MNDQQKQQVVEQIKSANHVLVTVSTNPTVDELAASIGLTLAINKLDKHATTVFSGHVPSTIEFLQPEKTIETTTDSLRDFIIALDKSKADKLRYKVEDDVVRIFITPYRTTITDKDLEFSQGDFNVDLVLGLGVTRRQDLDTAITAHGRILHDATIVALTKREAVSELGSINWQDSQASSLCEMVASLITIIQPDVIDGQMATAFLTGIIAETDRFKNDRTTPLALSLSAQLMSSGANQQLIAEKLDKPEAAPELHTEELPTGDQRTDQQRATGELEIDHSEDKIDNIHIDDDGNLNLAELLNDQSQELPHVPAEAENVNYDEPAEPQKSEDSGYLEKPEPQGNQDESKDLFDDLMSQNNYESGEEPTLKQPDSTNTPMMQHQLTIDPPVHPDDRPKSDKPFDPLEAMKAIGVTQPEAPQAAPESVAVPEPLITTTSGGDSLADLERSVGSSHVSASSPGETAHPTSPPELQALQESIEKDINDNPENSEPPKVDNNSHDDANTDSRDPSAPPPVPPPMTPQFYDSDGNNANPFLNPHE